VRDPYCFDSGIIPAIYDEMLGRSIVLGLAFLHQVQVQGSRLGSPRDEDTTGHGWAWKDVDGHHAPPGHGLNSADRSGHAWAGKGKQWGGEKPTADNYTPEPMQAGAARKLVDADSEEFSSDKEYHAKYDQRQKQIKVKSSSGLVTGGSTDLQSTLEQDCEDSMTLKDFMPKCLKHTKSLIADLDYNYGDAQLYTILRNWCQSAKEFPVTRGTRKAIGFKNHETCFAFAGDLKNARFYELSHKSDKGYKEFCSAFYGHHGGFDVPPPPPKKESAPVYNSASFAGFSMVLMSLALCLL